MSDIQISPEMTVLEVTEKYPATIQALVDSGFPKMKDVAARRVQGKALTLKAAATLRKMDAAKLVERLVAAADEEAKSAEADVTLQQAQHAERLLEIFGNRGRSVAL